MSPLPNNEREYRHVSQVTGKGPSVQPQSNSAGQTRVHQGGSIRDTTGLARRSSPLKTRTASKCPGSRANSERRTEPQPWP
jgi:hypothetical protein